MPPVRVKIKVDNNSVATRKDYKGYTQNNHLLRIKKTTGYKNEIASKY